MNGSYSIVGGRRLEGTVVPIPNKNSLMGALPLAILETPGFTIKNLPETSDVLGFLEIFESLQIRSAKKGRDYLFESHDLNSPHIRSERARSFRGSFSLAGPLLARFGEARLPIPGGCKLGVRSIATHVNGFRDLGIEVEESGTGVQLRRPSRGPRNHSIWLPEASVTATINLSSYAAAVDGEVEIRNAACEPHVSDVLNALQGMGAHIEGIGSNHLRIHGQRDLGSIEFEATPDFVDTSGYCVAAAVTRGKIRIKNGNRCGHMTGIARWISKFNVDISFDDEDVLVDGSGELVIHGRLFPKAGHDLPKLAVAPWPGFPVDVLPVMVTLAAKSRGRILFQNWMYESGFDFIRELIYMGAEIYMSDPQKIIVMEPRTRFTGGEVGSPGIIQGTKAIFLAALADPVRTVLHGTDILRRRYPNILDTYERLGARIDDLEA